MKSLPWAFKTFSSNFEKSWNNLILRGVFSLLLISYFCLTIYVGPVLIFATNLAIQIKCFTEIIDIGYKVYPVNDPPIFKLISWQLLVAANYFCYGETLKDYFGIFINKTVILNVLMRYYRFFSFCLYFLGIILFVISLRKSNHVHQFSIFACTHVTVLLIVIQSHMIVKNVFQGLIWFAIPITLVACNDMMGFLFGKFFGKTPLIKVSPKKTWEGFIGAATLTVLYGVIISYILCSYSYFVCPLKYVDEENQLNMIFDCKISDLFRLKHYVFDLNIPSVYHKEIILSLYPFMFHALILSLFSSIIAPFGGFFASGFKRAFNVKDFGQVIPGHGGVLDRFDCQFLMATFVNVYISTFIKSYSPEGIFNKVLYLDEKQQIEFFISLKELLSNTTYSYLEHIEL